MKTKLFTNICTNLVRLSMRKLNFLSGHYLPLNASNDAEIAKYFGKLRMEEHIVDEKCMFCG